METAAEKTIGFAKAVRLRDTLDFTGADLADANSQDNPAALLF